MPDKNRDVLTPEGKKFFSEIKKLNKLQVRVGFQQGDEQEEGVDLLDIAMWNELGTSSSPSRPFMRKSVDENEEKINAFLNVQIKKLAKGEATAEQVFKAVGAFQKGLVQEKIKNGEFEPNSPYTIKKKGSDKPLIDTGTMRQSVNFVITEKGGK